MAPSGDGVGALAEGLAEGLVGSAVSVGPVAGGAVLPPREASDPSTPTSCRAMKDPAPTSSAATASTRVRMDVPVMSSS